MKLYEQIANDIKDKIQQGFYPNGSKLPSLRHVCEERSVSLSTAQQSYRLLEQSGYAYARHKSGYYVSYRPPSLSLPQVSRPAQRPLEISQWDLVQVTLSSSVESEQPNALALSRGVPALDVDSLKPLSKHMTQASRSGFEAYMGASDLRGLAALRTQIARLAMNSGCQLHPDDLIVTNGCQEALSCALHSCTQPGDLVAIDSPGFYGVLQALKANHLKALEMPTDPLTGINIEALEQALERWPIKAILVCPTFQNPLGYSMPREKKLALLNLAKSYDLPLIEDDIFGDLAYRAPRPSSIKSFDDEGRVLMCSSFSKSVGPGLRLGWLAAGRYGSEAMHAKYVSSANNALLPQQAMANFIADGGYEHHLRNVVRRYRDNKDQILPLLMRYLPEGTRISNPDGGFLLWVELPNGIDAVTLSQRTLQRGVTVAPGPIFSASGKYRHCIRLNIGFPLNETLEQAFKTIGDEATQLLLNAVHLS